MTRTELDPLSAVTWPDPYPYYARLAAERPFGFDPALGLLVAAGAAAVEAVLTSDLMRVRPPAEPVPAALACTPPGEVFGQLVRMTDGPPQRELKRALTTALDGLHGPALAATSEHCANALAERLRPRTDPAALAAFALNLAPLVVAELIGLEPGHAAEVLHWAGEFSRALAPGGTPEQIARGSAATTALRAAVSDALRAGSGGTLLAAFARQARASGSGDDTIVVNTLGFFVQSYDATAGLIGNTLLALAWRPQLAAAVRGDAHLLRAVVAEVARFDAPVQNTRRFAAADGTLLGHPVCAGDPVLVVLAAANRDPAANPDPDRFEPARAQRRTYTFGLGAHACPGAQFATTIAATGVATLLAHGVELRALRAGSGYRPSANARIPTFLPPLSGA